MSHDSYPLEGTSMYRLGQAAACAMQRRQGWADATEEAIAHMLRTRYYDLLVAVRWTAIGMHRDANPGVSDAEAIRKGVEWESGALKLMIQGFREEIPAVEPAHVA